MNTQLFVERDNSMLGAVLANYAPFGASVTLLRSGYG
jgi:hypothetical protein